MSNRSADAVFQLIKSLEKSEKRNFKLFARRNSATENLKTIQLFDALDGITEYDEKLILKKAKGISKLQLSNVKANLYKQILSSLRLIKEEDNIDIHLHEQMDHARILYNKGLYLQSLKAIDKLKETARSYQQPTYLQQALFFEKKIEALYITRSIQNRADELLEESNKVSSEIIRVNTLSNLSLQLYSWYIHNGLARNPKDLKEVKQLFEKHLTVSANQLSSFYEKLYFYQSKCWYAFICRDFLNHFRYSKKWVTLFETSHGMIKAETALYIKGMHNLMSAYFDLQNHQKLSATIKQFEKFTETKAVTQNENNRILAYQYLYTSKINLCFLQGRFTKGLHFVPFLEEMLKEYGLYLDTHRVLVFYYKIACLYFGSGNYDATIDYLNRIIHQKGDLRTDLQCYARLLHLIAHYELGNFDLLEYLSKSVYRYMAKMENLSKVEEAIFKFLRRSFKVGTYAIKSELERLFADLKIYERDPLESRAFAYLDVISWLESKINGVNVQDVIKEKYRSRK
ncbi:MAG TPA: hypothetical protein PK504_01310 [Ferruginibacter sp.]|nr:hypothetical protein [Ferruginibacter sp.]HRE63049.1 hypothetical protein [Ferruginibacter sp.]